MKFKLASFIKIELTGNVANFVSRELKSKLCNKIGEYIKTDDTGGPTKNKNLETTIPFFSFLVHFGIEINFRFLAIYI